MTSPVLAARAYSSISSLAGAAGAAPAAASPDGGFGAMLERTMSGIAESGKAADAQAMQAVSGRGDIVDVVTAVAESEVALETLVSVRDKVISAYEEIMRMPI
jgi:flagellar hook-basal body complex protein FliE